MSEKLYSEVLSTGLADEIAFRLEAEILEGVLPPGTRLFQRDLARRFNVSRMPIREALRKLQALQLLVHVPNKGVTVRTISRKALVEVYEVRALTEGFACRLAASRITQAELNQLNSPQEILKSAAERFEKSDIDRSEEAAFNDLLTNANEGFHGIIHRAAGNERLCQVIADLQEFFPKDYVWRAIGSAHTFLELNIEEHGRIKKALKRGEGELASALMKSHINHAGALLLKYLDERGFWK